MTKRKKKLDTSVLKRRFRDDRDLIIIALTSLIDQSEALTSLNDQSAKLLFKNHATFTFSEFKTFKTTRDYYS